MADVLGLPRVGADDDFFSLGGDSIVSIQLVSRLRSRGWTLSPRQIFRLRTPAALADRLEGVGELVVEDEESGWGSVPATPILEWLRELGGPLGEYSQSTVLQVPAAMRWEQLLVAVQALVDRHQLLRSRLDRTGDGGDGPWRLEVPEPGALRAADVVERVDASGTPQGRPLAETMGARLMSLVRELDPDAGRMFKAVWFDAGPDRPGRLLLLAHHLVVDGVTWRILHPDLRQAWEAAAGGRAPELPAVPTSFRTWARGLLKAAAEPSREAEEAHWTRTLAGADVPLAGRALDPSVDTVRTLEHLRVELPAEYTELLLSTVVARTGAPVDALLLGALSRAFADWRGSRTGGGGEARERDGAARGGGHTVVAMEGHGREQQVVPGADLSRTAGWFTSVRPVALDASGVPGGQEGLPELVRRAARELAAVPDGGIGYGMLRYLNPRTGPRLAEVGVPETQFNYLGRYTGPPAPDGGPDGPAGSGDWAPAPEAGVLGGGRDLDMPVGYVLDVTASAVDGPDGRPVLGAGWVWAGRLLTEPEVRELAEGWVAALRRLVEEVTGGR
nr:condensation domain-containing protein [Streptomyces sp. HNM0575]